MKSRRSYKAIFENTGNATVIMDNDKTISLANSNFCKLVDLTKGEIEGKISWTEFVPTSDRVWMEKNHELRRRNHTTIPKVYESRIINKEHKIINVLITVDVIPDTKKSVASVMDITERKAAQEKIEKLAISDSLTGIYNRRYIMERIEAEFSRSSRNGVPFSVAFIDIDYFKKINDRFGHSAGDSIIKTFAQVAKNQYVMLTSLPVLVGMNF